MSAGDGHVSIVSSQQLGDLGSAQGIPVGFHWRWYHHVPRLALWVLILLLLILVRGNHKWQAWLILLPPLAVMVAWRMIARLLSLPPSAEELAGGVLVSLAAAWAIVWLLGHWLAGRNRITAFFSSLVVMLLVGGLSCWCFFGLGSDQDLARWSIFYGMSSFVLLVATTLSGFCCRGEYRPKVFMAWMILWTLLAYAIVVPILAVVEAVYRAAGFFDSLIVFFSVLFSCLVLGGTLGVTLYVMNLPFMLLATRSVFFRERFRRFFHLTQVPLDKLGTRRVVAWGEEL